MVNHGPPKLRVESSNLSFSVEFLFYFALNAHNIARIPAISPSQLIALALADFVYSV